MLLDCLSPFGGAERFVAGLASHLPQDRIEPWVCATRHGDERMVAALTDAGVRYVELGRGAKWQVHRMVGLAWLIRRHRIDVVHSHMFGSNLWGTVIGRACGVSVVIPHEHGRSYDGTRARAWMVGHVIGPLATRLVTVSQALRTQMVELEGVPATKVIVMPTAYIPHAVSNGTDLRAELELDSDARMIAVAAVLRPEKSLEVLLEAYAQLRTRIDSLHLVIAGDGPCRADLEHHAEVLGIRDGVHFLGPRKDVDAILRSVDVAAMSSEREGMPLFMFESMAASTPLVATAVGAIPEILENGTTGLLVPPGDPGALAGALERVLQDRGLARSLADRAASRREEFTIERVAGLFAGLYEQLASEARRR